jgi:hypothetical protein
MVFGEGSVIAPHFTNFVTSQQRGTNQQQFPSLESYMASHMQQYSSDSYYSVFSGATSQLKECSSQVSSNNCADVTRGSGSGTMSDVLSAENLHTHNQTDISRPRSLSAKTSHESMHSAPPHTYQAAVPNSPFSSSLVGPPVPVVAPFSPQSTPASSPHRPLVSHWAGLLQFDAARNLQVWKGTWVYGNGDNNVNNNEQIVPDKPPPSAFARSANDFAFTTDVLSSGDPGAPQSGCMKGFYFYQGTGECSVKQCFEDRELYIEFSRIEGTNKYTASGSGESEFGTFIINGQYSTISCVLEITRQYISE